MTSSHDTSRFVEFSMRPSSVSRFVEVCVRFGAE
jgi:hypothetical protein